MRPETKREWRPLLEGAEARRALATVEAIAAAISKHGARTRPLRNPSLASGDAGLAIFYAYLARAIGASRYQRMASRFLERAGEAVGTVTMPPGLYGGFAGVAWAVVHLERELSDHDGGTSTEQVDGALEVFLRRRRWRGDYDLVSGLVGLGVYASERLPARAAVACLEGVIDRLEEVAERRDDGVTWHTAPELLSAWQRDLCPRGYYNLGLAHGVPGVIAVLGAASAAGVRRRKTEKLLEGAVTWLLRQKRKERDGSRFSSWIVPGAGRENSRSAWCYGDPGVAAALFCAARAVGEPAWEKEALAIARNAADRPPDQAGVVDAGLCHGAAGLGHIFNRLHQATGGEKFGRAARFWLERTLSMRKPGKGVGGFLALSADEKGNRFWDDDPGFLTGASGIALALLAATTSIEPDWDRLLLISARNQGSRLERRTR